MDAPSGKFLSGNQEIWGVKGTEQVKRINTVIIRGGLIAGEQIDYTAQDASLTGAAGIVYYVDTYPDITDETVLSGIAANILDREKQAPLECNLFYRNESEGLYQVGETVYVSGGIIFNKNGDTIPENDYIIKGCKYYIRSGNYKAIDFNIADGLVFRKEVGDSLPEQNYVAIQQNAADIHDIEVGAAPDHNLLDGLNAGTNYEHITQTQKDALHDKYTDAEVDAIVATHTADDDAHHAVFEPGDEDAAIATHAALGDEHHPEAHKATHENGGGDEISVAGLSGELADEQDAGKIKGQTVDTTGIADTKILKYNGANWVIADDSTGGAGGDTDAIHDNVSGEIVVITEKTAPTITDEIIIEDAAAANAKKSAKLGNIDIAGDVSGKLSATVVANDSHTHDTRYYSEAEIQDFLHIGTTNKGTIALILDGAFIHEYIRMDNALGNYYNRDGSDFQIFFQIPLPLQLADGKHLHVDYIYVYLYDADGSNYLNDFSVRGKTSATTTTLYNNTANQTSTGLKNYSTGTDDWGDYKRVVVVVNVVCATGAAWEMAYVQARYWYA